MNRKAAENWVTKGPCLRINCLFIFAFQQDSARENWGKDFKSGEEYQSDFRLSFEFYGEVRNGALGQTVKLRSVMVIVILPTTQRNLMAKVPDKMDRKIGLLSYVQIYLNS